MTWITFKAKGDARKTSDSCNKIQIEERSNKPQVGIYRIWFTESVRETQTPGLEN